MRQRTIVIAGGTGLLGSACADQFRAKGDRVIILSRSKSDNPDIVTWDPLAETIDRNVIDGSDAVINLTGRPLDDQRWTKSYKETLLKSRTVPAHYLGSLIDQSSEPPSVYVGAAGVGIYADSGIELVDENYKAHNPSHFVVDMAEKWEDAHPSQGGMRRVVLRISVVMAKEGGFLPSVLAPARAGVYGYFGDGSQYLAWIHIKDLARVVVHAVDDDRMNGVYNAAAGAEALKSVMTQLKQARSAPGILASVPEFAIRLLLGEMAEILMWSCNPDPQKLHDTGFHYQYTDVKEAFIDLLK